MTDVIKDIRSRLRLAMNGVVSTSMRQKGIDYKLNFGVSLPKIKEIANQYKKDVILAEILWAEDVRELKILATLLYPIESFTQETAEKWIKEVQHQEIAEQYCHNLLQHLPYADELALSLIFSEDKEYESVIGFLLYARLLTNGLALGDGQADTLINQAKKEMDKGLSRCQRAAVLALKRYGRQRPEQAAKVLQSIADYSSSALPDKQEFFNDLKFEFDYYH